MDKYVEMKNCSYNYVIFGTENDYYLAAYKDIEQCANAIYLYRPIDSPNKLLTNLYRFHTSPKTNGIIRLPFQEIWNPMMFRRSFEEERPICFVFFARKERMLDNGIISFLKTVYTDSKFVMFFQDLISKKDSQAYIASIKKDFNLILTFDQRDAQKYNLLYHPLVYSDLQFEKDGFQDSDVYFVGKAKDRLSDILDVYEKLNEAGLVCDFHITGVHQNDQKYAENIDYCGQMSYSENLQRIKACRCIVEIMQKQGNGHTLRTCEAITFGRKMLTNNPQVKSESFFNADFIQTFSAASEIDTDFVRRGAKDVNYHYKEKLSPIHMLKYIDRQLIGGR